MTDPINSQYDTTPLPAVDDSADAGDLGPDHGKDLSGLVPTDKVAWGEPPSFNIDPKKIAQDPGTEPPVAAAELSGDLKIDLGAVRTTERAMLTESRAAVAKYEEVRAKVMAKKDTVFGQGAHTDGHYNNLNEKSYNFYTPGKDNPFAPAGEAFAADMNPAMERALLQAGMALEKLGEYIALINNSGQVYAHTDRESRFPEPPAAH